MTEEKTVLYERQPPLGIITLNRPEKYNALSVPMMRALAGLLDEVGEGEEVRVVIVTGGDRCFSTGADIADALQPKTIAETHAYIKNWRTLNDKVERLGKPVIAAISGYCLTGGLELAMACDIRIAASDAQFAITSVRIGSVAAAGGTQRLPRLVGLTKAKEMLLMGDFIDAQEAHRIGLVNRVVPAGQAMEEARRMAATMAERAPISLRLVKLAVNTGFNLDLASALDFEASCVTAAWTTEDRQEGMRAFLEKRRAVFKGR